MPRCGRLEAALMIGVLCATPARAAKPTVHPESFDSRIIQIVGSMSLAAPTALCTLGESGTPVFVVNYLVPPNDAYYVLLSAIRCAPCTPPNTSTLADAKILLNFPTLCSIPLKLSVVAATGPDSCRRPDPTTVLCGEQSTMLTPTETGATMFTVPMPPGCRVEGDAFLKLEFPSLPDACSELAQRPRLVTSDHCSACEVYNIYSFGNDDLCALQFPGQPIMYSTVETCAVPTLTRSWGSLKILYR